MGVSGGEEGARHGPSIMPGGPKEVYERVRPIFEAAAAKVNGDPCVTWLGPSFTGHFVKMVYNGIEYGVMQLIAETYDLMKRGLDLNDDEMHEVYKQLCRALYVAIITTYVQGFALLAIASDKYKYNIDFEAVSRIWQGGCIIRATLLEDICAAFRARRDLPNLLLDLNYSCRSG